MKYPSDVSSVYSIEVVDSLTQIVFEIDGSDKLQIAICENMSLDSFEDATDQLMIDSELKEVVQKLEVLKLEIKCEFFF